MDLDIGCVMIPCEIQLFLKGKVKLYFDKLTVNIGKHIDQVNVCFLSGPSSHDFIYKYHKLFEVPVYDYWKVHCYSKK